MINFAKIAAGTKPAADAELPASSRKNSTLNPFTELVAKAAEDGLRFDLPGRYSATPYPGKKGACYPGKKGACEASTITSKLHQAARVEGVKLAVRRFDATEAGVRIAFRVQA